MRRVLVQGNQCTLPRCNQLLPSLAVLLNVEPQMIPGFSCIISKCRVCTRVKRGRCSFTIGRLLESPQHLLRDHMIARTCILGLGQLGYQRRNERSCCLFTICNNYNQNQPHGVIITTLVTMAMYVMMTKATGTTVNAMSSAVMMMPCTTTVKSKYHLLMK